MSLFVLIYFSPNISEVKVNSDWPSLITFPSIEAASSVALSLLSTADPTPSYKLSVNMRPSGSFVWRDAHIQDTP